jgi:hypothetical protein
MGQSVSTVQDSHSRLEAIIYSDMSKSNVQNGGGLAINGSRSRRHRVDNAPNRRVIDIPMVTVPRPPPSAKYPTCHAGQSTKLHFT